MSVGYKTKPLDNSAETATPGVDYVDVEGRVTFAHQVMAATIDITILPREGEEQRDESFGL